MTNYLNALTPSVQVGYFASCLQVIFPDAICVTTTSESGDATITILSQTCGQKVYEVTRSTTGRFYLGQRITFLEDIPRESHARWVGI